jgi:ATP/maltotriose-dependent transcriptional regulator MalT
MPWPTGSPSAERNRLAMRHPEASRLYDQNPELPSHADALAAQSTALLSQKQPAEAELKLRQCLKIRQKVQPDDWATFEAKSMLGEALFEQKKYAEAEPLLLACYEGLKQRQAKVPAEARPHLTQALERLVRLYEASGKKEEADKWRKELEAAQGAKKA